MIRVELPPGTVMEIGQHEGQSWRGAQLVALKFSTTEQLDALIAEAFAVRADISEEEPTSQN